MTKSDLIQRIANRENRTKAEAEQGVEATLSVIEEALANGENVDLRGFGKFQVSAREAREGRNPRTGERLTIGARKVVVFRPGKELAARVNGAEAPADGTGPLAEPSAGPAKAHGDKIGS